MNVKMTEMKTKQIKLMDVKVKLKNTMKENLVGLEKKKKKPSHMERD